MSASQLKKKIIILSVFIFCTELFAEGGSNYSLFGIGDIIQNPSAVFEGNAGTSIAMPSDHGINVRNPALFSKVTTTRLQVGYRFNQNAVLDRDFSISQNNGNVDAILGIFSIDTSVGLGISYGIRRMTSVNYLTSNYSEVILDSLKVAGETKYTGSGGISQAYIGFGWSVLDWLSIGASVYTTFGISKASAVTKMYDYYSYLASNKKEDTYHGFGINTGIFIEPFENFGIGAFLDYQPDFSVDSKVTFESEVLSDTNFTTKNSYDMPFSYGFGLSFKSGRFIAGADISFQDFTGFSYRTGPEMSMKKSTNISFGLSRLGDFSAGSKLIDKTRLNFGIGYKDLYYSVKGVDISEYFAAIGAEIPVVGTTTFDAAFVFGTRGENSNGCVQELFGRFVFNLSIGEIWFKPYKREYE